MARRQAGFVEDSDEDFALFSRVFSDRWELRRWETGEAATEALARTEAQVAAYEVFMVDHDLPGMNGVAVIERIRASSGGDEPLVCMVSGTGRPGISDSALAAGADAFFEKPGSVAGLRALAAQISALVATRGDSDL
ncbi:MAG: response regulator [Patulibacter minatonensis]